MPETAIRILVVDDHDMVRKGLGLLLETFEDFRVVGQAAHGEMAVALCQETQPDVVLMDIVMPVMDGVTAIQQIHRAQPETRIIALTSFDDENNVQQALKAGAVSYLLKNIGVEELATAVRKAAQGQSVLAPEAARILISASTRPPGVGHDLSDREREVLALMTRGLSNREIGLKLHISASTVKNHVSTILSKLGTSSRTEAAAEAIEYHLIEQPRRAFEAKA